MGKHTKKVGVAASEERGSSGRSVDRHACQLRHRLLQILGVRGFFNARHVCAAKVGRAGGLAEG
jgi:hypothetical protein